MIGAIIKTTSYPVSGNEAYLVGVRVDRDTVSLLLVLKL